MPIKPDDYQKACSILVAAGSQAADKLRGNKTKDSVPDEQGKDLLRAARDEFRNTDSGLPNLVSGMTNAHHDAIMKAAKVMGITHW